MNPKFICHGAERISLGFESAAQAEEFLKAQATNPNWIEQWSLRFHKNSVHNTTVVAECENSVNIKLL